MMDLLNQTVTIGQMIAALGTVAAVVALVCGGVILYVRHKVIRDEWT